MKRLITAIRERPFAAALALATVLAVVAGASVDEPAITTDWMLRSSIVYHGEVGLATFLALYVLIVLHRLAYHGLTPTKFGKHGAEIPDVTLIEEALENNKAAATSIAEARDHLLEEIEGLRRRVDDLEDPPSTGTDG
jgi:hypothetical protein